MPTISSSRVKPAETPVTALNASARVSPWAAACESLSRRMFSLPLFCSRRTPCGIGTLSLPLGPSTRSSSPMVSFTPEGTGMGFLPILDIAKSLLPDLTDQFAADVFLAGIAAGHKTSGSCQDVYAEAPEHARDLFRAHIHAAAGTGNTFDL